MTDYKHGITKTCKCGTTFYTPQSKSQQEFCSHACSIKWRKKRCDSKGDAKLICNFCKKEYAVPIRRKLSSKFCSQMCDVMSRQPADINLHRLELVPTVNGNIVKFSARVRQAKSQFFDHRLSARNRGIEFLLTFDEWWDVWLNSGHWAERGRSMGQYVMARSGDQGPYAVGNVRIIRAEQNCSEKTMPRGSQSATSKITEADVREIRHLEGKMKRKDVAKKFGISYWHVRDIQKGRSWNWFE